MNDLRPIIPEPRPTDTAIIILIAIMVCLFILGIVYGLNGIYEHYYYSGVIL